MSGVQDLDADLPRNRRQASSRSSCSNACRMKVYYGRIVQARDLRRQGLSVRQIADRSVRMRKPCAAGLERVNGIAGQAPTVKPEIADGAG